MNNPLELLFHYYPPISTTTNIFITKSQLGNKTYPHTSYLESFGHNFASRQRKRGTDTQGLSLSADPRQY